MPLPNGQLLNNNTAVIAHRPPFFTCPTKVARPGC